MIPRVCVKHHLTPHTLCIENGFLIHTAIGSVCFNQQRALPFCPCFSLFQFSRIVKRFSAEPYWNFSRTLLPFRSDINRKSGILPLPSISSPQRICTSSFTYSPSISFLNTYARMPHFRTPQCITLIFLPAFASMLCFLLYISVIFFILSFFVTKCSVFVIKNG